MKKRIGVLLSGRGSNFEALADSVAAGRIPGAEIALVISNREAAAGIGDPVWSVEEIVNLLEK